MRVLIAGGTGLIGRALSRSLVMDGHDVVVLTRNPQRTPRPVTSGVTFVRWDGRSAAGWGEWASGAAAIVNLAGEPISGGRWSPARKQSILQSRTEAGAALIDAVRLADVRPAVLLQASAVGYYGPHEDAAQVTETSPQGSDWLAHVCGAWEASTAEAPALGVRRPIARTGLVFSSEGGAFPKMKLPFDLLLGGGPMGSGRQILPWIHIDDEVRALRFLLEHPQAEGPFNLCAPGAADQRRFATTLGSLMGRPSFLPTPAVALRAAFGEMAQILLTGQNQIPERLVAMGFTFKYPELRGALSALLARHS